MNNQPFSPNPNNPMFSMFGGYNQFMQSFNAFAQQMMNSGQMNQQQFEWCRQMANQIMGTNF